MSDDPPPAPPSNRSRRLGGVGCLLFSLLWTGTAVFILVGGLSDEWDGPPGPQPSLFAWEGAIFWVAILPALLIGLAGVTLTVRALRLSPEQAAAKTVPPTVKPARAALIFVIGPLGLFGLVFALIGIHRVVRDVRFERDDLQVTEGRVDRIYKTDPPGGRPVQDLPVVRFEADDGPYEIYGRTARSGYYEVGQKVKVFYPPDNPRLGRMEGQTSGIDRSYNSYAAAIGGGVFVAAVLAIVWLLRRRPRLSPI